MKCPLLRSALLAGLLLSPPAFLHASDLPAVPDGEHPTWYLPEGAVVRLGKGRMGRSDRAISFSPDGRLLAVASGIGLWLYDMENPERQTLLPVEMANSASFSPDGTLLATGSFGSGSEKGNHPLGPGFGNGHSLRGNRGGPPCGLLPGWEKPGRPSVGRDPSVGRCDGYPYRHSSGTDLPGPFGGLLPGRDHTGFRTGRRNRRAVGPDHSRYANPGRT